MTAQNEITRAGTGSSAVNARFRWLSEHRLLALCSSPTASVGAC
jgi:hypothetical protein